MLSGGRWLPSNMEATNLFLIMFVYKTGTNFDLCRS